MTYKEQAEEEIHKLGFWEGEGKDYPKEKEKCLNRIEALKAKIEAEGCGRDFYTPVFERCRVIASNKLCPDCQEAINKLDEVLG